MFLVFECSVAYLGLSCNLRRSTMMKTTLCVSLAIATVALAEKPVPQTNAPSAPKTISIQEMLVVGNSGMRLHSLAMITQGNVAGGIDTSFLPGLKACSEDPATPVRSIAARVMGQDLVAGLDEPNPEAVGLLMKLATDESADVRYSAVYHGLTQIKKKPNKVVALLIDVAAANRERGLYDRIVDSLKEYQEVSARILDQKLKDGNNIALYEIYEDLTGRQPSDAEKYLAMPSSRPRMFIFKGKGGDAEAFKAELESELRSMGIQNPDLFISGVGDNYVLLLKTYLTQDRLAVEKAFADHGTFKISQDMWLTPELEIQIDSMRKKRP
jgi:hypothetical protein